MDQPVVALIVQPNGQQHGPHRPIDVVGSHNIHRNTHGRAVSNERVSGMTGGDDDRCANGLLAQMLLENPTLNSPDQLIPEESGNGRIDTAVHEPERVGRADHAIEGRQFFEPGGDDFNVGQVAKMLRQATLRAGCGSTSTSCRLAIFVGLG